MPTEEQTDGQEQITPNGCDMNTGFSIISFHVCKVLIIVSILMPKHML